MAEVGDALCGRYTFLSQIGEGGLFVVWLAQDVRSNRLWAIKEFMKDGASRELESWIDSVRAENAFLMSLNHPALSNVVDMVESDDALYVVTSYVSGNDLLSVMKRGLRAITEDDVVDWGIQLCDALQCLHDHNIIHRDVKPGNIMLCEDGSECGAIKLFGFNCVRAYELDEQYDLLPLGTRGYASPETFMPDNPTTPRSDIYSLGATLFHLATGRNPVAFGVALPSARVVNSAISPALDAIIAKATALKPEDRFQSCSEMRYFFETLPEPLLVYASPPRSLFARIVRAVKDV